MISVYDNLNEKERFISGNYGKPENDYSTPMIQTKGIYVMEIDEEFNLVLVKHNLGGTLEKDVWTPVASIQQVWKIGTLKEVLEKLGDFDKAFKEAIRS